MSTALSLSAEKRVLQGSPNARRIRRAGNVPAIVYGKDGENTMIQLDAHTFTQTMRKHVTEHLVVELDVEGTKINTLLKEVQHHPVSGDAVHIDFQEIDMSQKIHTALPIVVVGEAAGVAAGGLLELVLHNVEVECLPGDMVEEIDVDVSALEIGQAIHVSDLKLEKMTVLNAADAVVVHVEAPKVADEEADAEEAAE